MASPLSLIIPEQYEEEEEKVYLVYMKPGHFSGIVSAVAAGCLCFPSELKQMSAETPAQAQAQAQPPPPLPAILGVGGRCPAPKRTHRSAPRHAIVLSTAMDL